MNEYFYSGYIHDKDGVRVGFFHGSVSANAGDLFNLLTKQVKSHQRWVEGESQFHLIALNKLD